MKKKALTAKQRAEIDRNYDGMAALFRDDVKRTKIETAPPTPSALDILLDRLYELPIKWADQDLARKVLRFFDRVGSGKVTADTVYDALMFGAMLGQNPETAPTMAELSAQVMARFDSIDKEVSSDAMARKVRRGIFMAKNGTRPFPGRDPLVPEEKVKEYCARMWHLLNRKHQPMKSQKDAALDIIGRYQYPGDWKTLAVHYRSHPPKELEQVFEDLQKRGKSTD